MVKRAVLISGAVLGLAAVPASAQGSCGLGCLAHRISSLQRQVNSLQQQVATDNQALGRLNACMNEMPVSQYGDSFGGAFGYVWDTSYSTFYTTALDKTQPGDFIDAWFLTDSCNTQTTAVAHTAHVAGALAPEQLLQPTVRKHQP